LLQFCCRVQYNRQAFCSGIFTFQETTMSCDDTVDCGRRRLLVATSVAGGVAGVAVVVPFVSTFAPSERAKSAGAPVEVDVSRDRKSVV
jgi:ubiquinol-cytochrome c reductase iron-sulfur subunit